MRIEKALPVIVSKAQFNRVKRSIRSPRDRTALAKRTHPRRVGSTYLLGGLVRCKSCNRALSSQGAKSGQFACLAMILLSLYAAPGMAIYYMIALVLGTWFDWLARRSDRA